MKSMGFNFIKRAVAVPAIMTVIAVAVVFAAVRLAPAPQLAAEQTTQAVYQAQQFESISKLAAGDYVGKLVFDDKTERALTFAEAEGDTLTVSKDSVNPWQNGSVVITGTGATAQLGDLRHLKTGDTFTLEVSDHGTYKYKIKDVKVGLRDSDITALAAKTGKKKTVLLCRSYNDFSTAGKTKLYAVCTAQQTGGGNG